MTTALTSAIRRVAIASSCLLLLPACWGGDDDGEDPAPTDTGPAPTIASADSVVNEIPQNVSLAASMADGVLSVVNDGNVTMSSVTVADGAGTVVCDIGTLAPAATAECADAAPGDWQVTGSGPQGQPASATP